jgi:hypothetical protein
LANNPCLNEKIKILGWVLKEEMLELKINRADNVDTAVLFNDIEKTTYLQHKQISCIKM